jgi:hypothetical protein
MEALLRNRLTAHYGLPVAVITNIAQTTSEAYFEIEDDNHRELQVHTGIGTGMAKYRNVNAFGVTVINYDKFLTALPHAFQEGRRRCDVIMYTNTNLRYFLLNELKDRNPKPKVQSKSRKQLRATLDCIMQVPEILSFIGQFTIKRCCFFNKQPIAPATIIAPNAFNQFNLLVQDGIKMSDIVIEAYGFEFYEYTGNATLTLIS